MKKIEFHILNETDAQFQQILCYNLPHKSQYQTVRQKDLFLG